MTKEQFWKDFAAKYKTILGRNYYSQDRRGYCYKKYSNGVYYSDCSSSQALTYKEVGLTISYNGNTNPNTVGMYLSNDLVDVPVIIKNGVIQNPEILEVGDLLLFAGTDSSRAYAGYVGHVEAVYSINKTSGAITICGHGSNHPRTTEMNAYCKSRYNQKTSTKVKNKGVIKVRRHKLLMTNNVEEPKPITPEQPSNTEGSVNDMKITVTGSTVNIRRGPGTNYSVEKVAKKGETYYTIEEVDGWLPINVDGKLCWISSKYVKEDK